MDSFIFFRCTECGCSGCISTYNSITTNMLAMEQRITERMEFKIQQLCHHVDMRLDSLYDAIMTRQAETFAQPEYLSETDTAV